MTRRPIYETKAHRLGEENLRVRFAKAIGRLVPLLSDEAQPALDASILDSTGKVIGLVELKCRTSPFGQYRRGYMISKAKIDKGIAMCEEIGVRFTLVVAWSDRDGCTQLDRESLFRCEISVGGRGDRNDILDREVCYYIPLRFFRDLDCWQPEFKPR